MTVLGICLALAAAPAASIFVPAERFTLAWTHSIEKVRWEEDYAVLPGPPATLRALQARVRSVLHDVAVANDDWPKKAPKMVSKMVLGMRRKSRR